MPTTNEFSFLLKPAEHGIGVFAAHDIAKGTPLRLFADDDVGSDTSYRDMEITAIPRPFLDYCAIRPNGRAWCPLDFGRMAIGWYLNHSSDPNASHAGYKFFAVRDIREGEEVTIDYNSLDEPEDAKEPYYGR